MKICGVYKIVNLTNSKVYIGSTIDWIARRKSHKSALNNNRHHSSYLQKSWNRNGASNFKFELIEQLFFPPNYSRKVINEHLINLEQCFIDNVKPAYNTRRIAETKGIPNFTKEIREKISKSKIGKHHIYSTKVTISRAKTGNKVIEQYDRNKDLIALWNTVSEAAVYTGLTRQAISNNLNRYSNTCGGFIFVYKLISN